MAEEKKSAQSIKVTDKRLFTAEGDIREEFRESVKAADPNAPRPEPPKPPSPAPPPESGPARDEGKEADPAAPSETLFMGLIELLVYQAAMALQSQDLAGARQIIDIIDMLAEKTAGNLTESESRFLDARRGELKLAWVQRTKRI
ncbi:MAG TPA: DUF1844 domain-containing protein [Thermoanaerobaculia bacterium]|nr:DUF1844 domain-containing protein [Thermoanaerobaculia bacterium]